MVNKPLSMKRQELSASKVTGKIENWLGKTSDKKELDVGYPSVKTKIYTIIQLKCVKVTPIYDANRLDVAGDGDVAIEDQENASNKHLPDGDITDICYEIHTSESRR